MLYENLLINGTYRIIRPIGKGGIGVIYLAEHLHLRKKVVLKKINTDGAARQIVRQEADILKSLHHMYLPQVYDFIVYDQQVFTVIDYIDGKDLQYYIDIGAVFTEEQLTAWMFQMCDALDYLHTHNPPVYHNDIKPANIIINSEGNICLIDFNISTDAVDAVYGFTPEYASPEQYYRVLSITDPGYSGPVYQVGALSDLYSLGISVYKAASRMPVSVYNAVSGCQPRFSNLGTGYSEGFCMLIDALTERDPEKRIQSASELKKALNALKRQDVHYRRYWTSRVAALLLSGLLVIGGIWMIEQGRTELKISDFNSRYSTVMKKFNDESYSAVVDEGSELLADSNCKSIMNTSQNAKLCYMIGTSYSKQEYYDAAAEYLRRAVELERVPDSRCEYEMQQAINSAYLGDVAGAQLQLSQAQADGLDTTQVDYVRAQLCYVNHDYDQVIVEFNDAVNSGANGDIYFMFAELMGDSYSAKGDHSSAVMMYETVAKERHGMIITRKLAAEYVNCGQQQGVNQKDAAEQYKKAYTCYQQVCASEYCTAVDLINYGKICRILGNEKNYMPYYNESLNVLQRAQTEYPDDYRVYAELAFTYDKLNDRDMASYYILEAEARLSYAEQNEDYAEEKLMLENLKEKLSMT